MSGNAAKDAKMRGLYEYVNLLKVPSAITACKIHAKVELANADTRIRVTLRQDFSA